MNKRIEELRNKINDLREEVIHHKVYDHINNIDDLRIFMHYHVYAVWDFMSILKTLQNNITCTNVPWFPKRNGNSSYLINQIVLCEESDVDIEGNIKSHFEQYLDAMEQCGASTQSIKRFIEELKQTQDIEKAFELADTPLESRDFVRFTFDVIKSNVRYKFNANEPKKDYLPAAIFTFGREDLIPEMFISIINKIQKDATQNVAIFKYYIERHIEVDGDVHGKAAIELTTNLLGDEDPLWAEATTVVMKSLEMRVRLWDGILKTIAK